MRASGIEVSGSEDAEFDASRVQRATELFAACMVGDVGRAKQLIAAGADAWVQAIDGWTALHAAAYSTDDPSLVRALLRDGNAVWNMTDNLGNTAGDVAFSLNNNKVYEFLLEEAIRIEVLRHLLERQGSTDADAIEGDTQEESSGDALNAHSTASDNATYLASQLQFTEINGQHVCLDREGNGVMMGWERPIMQKTVELCAAHEGLAVLNVGFGLGIIDEEFQRHHPRKHVIIEPHPDVLAYAEMQGWFSRPNVEFFKGTWQQFKAHVLSSHDPTLFDAVYFDTYSEHYADLHEFFEFLPSILAPEGKFSFFHGLGATSRYFYDIYTRVSELHLNEELFDVSWVDLRVLDSFEGLQKKYWSVPSDYRLPVVTSRDTFM